MTDIRPEIDEEEFEVFRAMTGFQADDFKRSQLGQYIYDTIDRELIQLRQELEECDSRDVDENDRLRLEIRVRKMFIKFMEDAITSGRNAERNLEHMSTTQ